jgi:hypothetical protein
MHSDISARNAAGVFGRAPAKDYFIEEYKSYEYSA